MSEFAKALSLWRLPLCVLGCVGMISFAAWSLSEQGFAVKRVSVSGDLSQAQQSDIQRALGSLKAEGSKVQHVKTLLERIDWVHRVEVTRSWPDQLRVKVVPQLPIAYWNDDAFINAAGDVFSSDLIVGGDLVHLHGPAGTERAVMQQYRQLSDALLPAGLAIEVLDFNKRGAWRFVTTSGLEVLLGKEDIMARVQRFLQVAESERMLAQIDSARLVDTRYSNGLAVRWEEPPALDVATNFKMQRERKL